MRVVFPFIPTWFIYLLVLQQVTIQHNFYHLLFQQSAHLHTVNFHDAIDKYHINEKYLKIDHHKEWHFIRDLREKYLFTILWSKRERKSVSSNLTVEYLIRSWQFAYLIAHLNDL